MMQAKSTASPLASSLPKMTQAGLKPTYAVVAYDEQGLRREVNIAGENPLTVFVDGRELVTLMTLGTFPEALTIGYLRNQRFIQHLDELLEITVDWTRERVDVKTAHGIENWDARLQHRTVTTGCGQGTIFSCSINKTYDIHLPALTLTQSYIYRLLARLGEYNDVYRQAGAVHGCALCREEEILAFVEDVGRHNAADAIAGLMWLYDWSGQNVVFYTTGRLTSEIVMKTACMGIPVLLSRSGVTQMGLELAAEIGVTVIARAKGKHFLVYNGVENIIFDALPA
jgi:FdhD protein